MPYSVPLAYLLWFFGGFGMLGFHRLYLRKTATAVLWFFTGGLGFMGALYDLFTLRRQVEEANIKAGVKQVLDTQRYQLAGGYARPSAPPDTIEKVILRVAKKNDGMVSPGEVALESSYTVDQAQAALEKMAGKGNAEMLIRKSGVIVYRFAEFQRDANPDDYVG